VNYYEHHIRDYDAATAHLTWDQDMAYARLIRWYYRKEQPIPADIAEACRQVRATSKPQRDAVEAVLKEFFVLREDGWHQETCDDAIAVFKAGEPEREAKKKNEDTRLARHRAERAELFGVINGAGVHMAWNTPIAELRASAERIRTGAATPPATPSSGKPATPATQPATAPATPATATQTPDTRHQTPEDKENPSDSLAPDKPARKAKGSKRVPATFEVEPDLEAWATTNAPLVDWRRETQAFRDWEFKHARTDWKATWRTWMRNAQKRAEETPTRSAGTAANDWTRSAA
jgi:uncharacterized protein YdaU (DUF1376 family)